MNTLRKHLLITSSFFIMLCVGIPADAKVHVTVNGTSDGTSLQSEQGPLGIGTEALVNLSGGTIAPAKAKAKFTKEKLIIGNKVESTGTSGDTNITHVHAGSIFAGTTKVKLPNGKKRTKNYTLDLHFNGTIRCKNSDTSLPEGVSLAKVRSEVLVEGADVFTGIATQDGANEFYAVGDFLGEFTKEDNSATINKTIPIKLGRVYDGQQLDVRILLSTLVSYGAGVPVEYCEADFFEGDSLTQSDESNGHIQNTPGSPMDYYFDQNTYDLLNPPASFTVYAETKNQNTLQRMKRNTVEMYSYLGDDGYISPESLGSVGDADGDGIADRAMIFDGQDMSTLLGNTASDDIVELLIAGTTKKHKTFLGTAELTLE